ncbi:MAG: amidohydrolase [Egibacteraceae bacterium]
MRTETPPLLLVADRVRTLASALPEARVVLVEDGWIQWVGDQPDDAPRNRARRVDLAGALLQPAFVDAHAHLTATGLALGGADLTMCRSVADCLAAVQAIAEITPGEVIWGSGWDDLSYPEGRPPTGDELTQAAGGRPVLLTRVDGHSAVIDRISLKAAPLERAEGVERDASGRPTGLLRKEAVNVARRWFCAELPDAQLAQARYAIARHAASLGIASVHEMSGPDQMGARDFDAWLQGDWPIEVIGYWGADDLDFVAARGLRQVGGALHLDGTLGSHTAALEEDYADAPGAGHLYESDAEIVAFLIEATRRHFQVGLHCIGDRAVRQAAEVLEAVAGRLGLRAVRAVRHRLEHCALVPPPLIPRLATLGVVASVQPTFDALWGHRGGLYQQRLGRQRAERMNPLGPLAGAGITLAFGSDPSSTLDPWATVSAAVSHHRPEFRIDVSTALQAATIGGRRAARQHRVGPIAVGQRADLAAFAIQGDRAERCVLTMVHGRVVHGPDDIRS